MSNYKFADRNKVPPPHQRGVHPVMRGIGCIMMIIVPVLAYIASDLLIESGFGRGVIPPAWYQRIQFPPFLMQLSGLAVVLRAIGRIEHLPANLVFTTVIVIIVGGVMSIFYGYVYSLFGPSKYGPTDEPPIRVKVKRYKR